MNFATSFLSLVTGFGVSFVVLDVSRIASRGRWPSAHGVVVDNFRAFAVFLALFAGPALFVRALWRMRMTAGRLPFADSVLGVVIAGGWACCYGLVVIQCAALLGLPVR
ncbi:hypothetical protein LP421_09930 [Rhizobium sp. RCAM05350]|nr:hypothetical protein LP421_09930 [Rhizobium sp. RCAM05350]